MSSFKNYKRSIVLDFNYDSIKQGVPDVNKQMALLNAEFRKASTEAELNGNSFDRLGVKQEMLGNKLKLQGDKVSKLKEELEKLDATDQKNAKTITSKTIELRNAETQYMKLESQLGKVNKEVEAQTSKLGTVATKWKDFKGNMSEAGIDLERVSTNMQRVGAAMMSIGVVGATMSMSFDKEFAKVKTIADETQTSFNDLRKGALKVSGDINISANETANALYNIVSANVATGDSLEVLEGTAKLARAGFTDIGTSVDITTTLLNAYGGSVKDVNRYSDQLIMTQKLGKVTVGELGKDFGKVAGLAATAKVEFSQVGAAVSVLTTNGIKANESLTGMKAILSSVIKPSKEAADTAKELGLKFDLAALQVKGLDGFLSDVQRRTRGNTDEMAKLFGSVEALNAVLILTSQNGASQFKTNLEQINNASGTTTQALELLNTPGEKLSKSFNELKNTMIEVGDSFSPVINMVSGFFEILSKVPPGVLVTIAVLGAMVATIGTIIKTVNTTMGAIDGVSKVITKFSGGLSPLEMKILKIGGAILLVVAALTALLAIWAAITGKSGEVERVTNSVGNSFSGMKSSVEDIKRSASSSNTRGYAIGTQYVQEDGFYDVHANERVYLGKGTRVMNARETAQDKAQDKANASVDTSAMENLLSAVVSRLDRLDGSIKNIAREQEQRLRTS